MSSRKCLAPSFVLLLLTGVACGDDSSGSGGTSNGGSPQGGDTTQGGDSSQGGDAPQGGMGGAPVADSEPMGIDCTDSCPSFEGRTYVCTFLPGFSTTLGYCSIECTAAGPACPDTEPGEVYCNTEVGACVIGCPFDGCPGEMDCTFNFNGEPACEPVP